MVSKILALKMLQLESELENLGTASALTLLDARLATEVDMTFALQMQISKAKLLAAEGNLDSAISLLHQCSKSPLTDESAPYFAAEILVEEGRLPEAVEFLEIAERQIEVSGSTYYRDCIFLLHAFCEAKLGRIGRARQLLNEVADEDEALFWLKADPVISVRSVKNLTTTRE